MGSGHSFLGILINNFKKFNNNNYDWQFVEMCCESTAVNAFYPSGASAYFVRPCKKGMTIRIKGEISDFFYCSVEVYSVRAKMVRGVFSPEGVLFSVDSFDANFWDSKGRMKVGFNMSNDGLVVLRWYSNKLITKVGRLDIISKVFETLPSIAVLQEDDKSWVKMDRLPLSKLFQNSFELQQEILSSNIDKRGTIKLDKSCYCSWNIPVTGVGGAGFFPNKSASYLVCPGAKGVRINKELLKSLITSGRKYLDIMYGDNKTVVYDFKVIILGNKLINSEDVIFTPENLENPVLIIREIFVGYGGLKDPSNHKNILRIVNEALIPIVCTNE